MERNIAIASLMRVIQSSRAFNYIKSSKSPLKRKSKIRTDQPQTAAYEHVKINDNAPTQLSPPVEDSSATYEETKQELNEAIYGSNEVLLTAKTVFSLFPDTIVLDRAKLTITKRKSIGSADIVSLRIEDILNITASVGPLFGQVTITSRVLGAEPLIIPKLTRGDALRLKRIGQGYIMVLQREIDCNKIPTRELIGMLDKLGEDEHTGSAPVAAPVIILKK
jgi:hypothetical protein